MSNTPKLAIFDLDGTIAIEGKVVPSVIEGLGRLHTQDCITTLSTGRGYARLRDTLGDDFDKVVSDQAIIVLEHGTKLVDKAGKIIFGEFLSADEIEHIIDFVRANIGLFKFAWMNHDNSKTVSIWCVDEVDVDEQVQARGHYANVFTSSIGDLKERLLQERLTSIGFRLKEHIQVENLKLQFTRTETSIIFQDGNMEFMRNNINKGLSVLKVLDILKLTKADTLIAGNAINDIEMLDIGAGTSILVGSTEYRESILPYLSDPGAITGINAPDALGTYLSTL